MQRNKNQKGEGIMQKRENFSRKRTAILNALRGTRSHPTADQLYGQLKPEHPDLSLGTVYRNLKMFCNTGKAVSVGVINGQEHFDSFVHPHAHFVCEKCGAVLDVEKNFFGPEELGELSGSTGWKVKSASVMFYGVCGDCQAAGESENTKASEN